MASTVASSVAVVAKESRVVGGPVPLREVPRVEPRRLLTIERRTKSRHRRRQHIGRRDSRDRSLCDSLREVVRCGGR